MSRRLLASYLTLTVFVLAVLVVPLGISHARSERRDLTSKVERDAVVMTTFAEDFLEGRSGAIKTGLQGVAQRYQQATGGRIVIVNDKGVSVVDSSQPGAPGREFSSRPEIASALGGQIATGARHSTTLATDLLYVAVPVASGGVVHGAVRITYPMSAVDTRILRYWLMLAAISAVVLLVVGLVGLRLARSFSRPLADVERAAAAAGGGDLQVRAPENEGPPEVRALAASFNDTVRKLDDLVRSREAFVADASHQLRTPLAALRLRLENLEQDVALGARGDLDAALAEVSRLSHLVDGLLELARTDTTTAAPQAIDLERTIEERLQLWSPLATEQEVKLGHGVESRIAARATPGHLEQVLDNLIANALEASPAGATITISAVAIDGSVEIHVVDEGPGMSDEERAHAFDRFWRAASDEHGSGLGLAIVERLVAADGGRVELRPSPTGGIDAVVRLRAAATQDREKAARHPSPGPR
jgi:signal transduction histidine kinase